MVYGPCVVLVRLAASTCQLRHDQMEQGPTEPHAGRSTFLLIFGGAGGRVLRSGLWYPEPFPLPDAIGMSGHDPFFCGGGGEVGMNAGGGGGGAGRGTFLLSSGVAEGGYYCRAGCD